jgi:hypothetical protein
VINIGRSRGCVTQGIMKNWKCVPPRSPLLSIPSSASMSPIARGAKFSARLRPLTIKAPHFVKPD